MMHILTPERYCDEQVITFPKVAGATPDLPVGTWVKPVGGSWDVYAPIADGDDVSLAFAPLVLNTKRPDSADGMIPGVPNEVISDVPNRKYKAFVGLVDKSVILRNWDDKMVITDQIVGAGALPVGAELTVDAGATNAGKLRLRAATEPLFGIFFGVNTTKYGDGSTGYVVKLKAQAVIA